MCNITAAEKNIILVLVRNRYPTRKGADEANRI
jgi:hypothetical protein